MNKKAYLNNQVTRKQIQTLANKKGVKVQFKTQQGIIYVKVGKIKNPMRLIDAIDNLSKRMSRYEEI